MATDDDGRRNDGADDDGRTTDDDNDEVHMYTSTHAQIARVKVHRYIHKHINSSMNDSDIF